MTPEQEEQVRRALGSVPDQPMPPEVAARLEAQLEELQAERTTATNRTEDPERRTRRWPRLLVAAAMLGVLGVGAGTVLDGSSMDSMTAGGEAARDTAEQGGDPPATESAPEEEVPLAEAAPSASREYSAATGKVADRLILTANRVELRSATLEEDVVDFLVLRLPRAAADGDAELHRLEEPGAEAHRTRLFAPCLLPPTGRGDQLVAVRLDGSPATLVLRDPRDGTRVAQVYSCEDPARLLGRTEVDPR